MNADRPGGPENEDAAKELRLVRDNLPVLHEMLDPIKPFRVSWKQLRARLLKRKLKRRIRFERRPIASRATMRSRQHPISWFGYQIGASTNFAPALRDTAEFYGVRIVVVSVEGKLRQPTELSAEECIEAIARKVVLQFRNGAWPITSFDLIRIERMRRELTIPEAQGRGNTIEFMIVQTRDFALLHEAGHIELGHCDRTGTQTQQESFRDEFDADAWATEAMMSDLSNDQVFAPFGNEAEAYRAMWHVGTATAIGMLFAIQEIMARAAHALNEPWDENYPPAMERYQRFRDQSINRHNIQPKVFDGRASLLESPDRFIGALLDRAHGIDWISVRENAALKEDAAFGDAIRNMIDSKRPEN